MSDEPKTGLPYWPAGALQQDLIFNELLRFLGAVGAPATVKDKDLATPPGSPADGDTYIVAAAPTGAWTGHAKDIAYNDAGTWIFFTPSEGWRLDVADEDIVYRYSGAAWVTATTADSPVGRHLIPIMAGSIAPKAAAGCASLATLAGASGQPDVSYLAFDPTTEEHAQFAIAMPKSWNEGTVTFVPRWAHPATATNFGVCWKLRALAVSNDDNVVASFGTAQSSVDTGGTTSDHYAGPESSAITIAGTPASQDLVFFDIYRDPADAGDTMAVDAYLIGVDLFVTTDASTDT